MFELMPKEQVASFDVDAQNTFTPLCPNELPVPEGDMIVPELNGQAMFANKRVASRDAHSLNAVWIANEDSPQLSKVEGYKDVDVRWNAHAIIGTFGFEFINGLEESQYDFQVFKGIDPKKHPYGACYHDLEDKESTGIIEYLKLNGIKQVIVGGLATEFCVKKTVLQLLDAGFSVVLNLGASRGFVIEEAVTEMKECGAVVVNSYQELRQKPKKTPSI